jgi:ABC-type protease/lipase transport system fused ATPase/permease subunit
VIYGNNPSLPSGFIYTLNLARVFLKNSNIILLDELPNASLNEDAGSAYKKLISDSKEQKKTVFFVSQRDDYIKLADRVIVLRSGLRPTIMTSEEFINKYGQY